MPSALLVSLHSCLFILDTHFTPLTVLRTAEQTLWERLYIYHISMSSSQPTSTGTQKERDFDSRQNIAISDSILLIGKPMQQLAKPCSAPEQTSDQEADQDAGHDPVSAQDHLNLDFRLNIAMLDSSSLIEQALQQLAKPCSAPDEETDDEECLPTPIDVTITRSNQLLGEARDQLRSPNIAPIELTESELAEKKAAEAWLQTYRSIERTNEVRLSAGQDFLGSILKDIKELDESNQVVGYQTTTFVSPSKRTTDSSVGAREERRAKRAMRVCGGPSVAAVVAKIEAIDDLAPSDPPKYVRIAGVRSFSK